MFAINFVSRFKYQHGKTHHFCRRSIKLLTNTKAAKSTSVMEQDKQDNNITFRGKNFNDWSQEELAMLTETDKYLPLVEMIMDSPLCIQEWEQMPKSQRNKYNILTDAISHENVQSISKILRNTKHPLSEVILERWRKKNIEKIGEKKFNAYQANTRREGSEFHKLIQQYLKAEITTKGDGSSQWKSVQSFLSEISPDDVHSVETDVIHPLLLYCGRLDCSVVYKNRLCIIDWKLSAKRKDKLKDLYDDPYQVAAYVGAFNVLNDSSTQISNAIIVKAYRDGSPASVHNLNEFALGFYWQGWLRRLARSHIRQLSALNEGSI